MTDSNYGAASLQNGTTPSYGVWGTCMHVHSVISHLSMEFACTIWTTQVEKNPIHMGHPSPAKILLYSCGTDKARPTIVPVPHRLARIVL